MKPFIVTILLTFLSFGLAKKTIELRLKPKIRTSNYIVRELSINYDRKFGFRRLTEYSFQNKTKPSGKKGVINFESKYLYFLISKYSVHKNNTETYDTRIKDIVQTSNFANRYKILRKDLNIPYTISLSDKGKIIKGWNLKNGSIDISIFQIVFPNKSLSIDEEWEYESKGVFESYLKSKKKFWVKEIKNKEICIGYKSELISNDLQNGLTTEGEYILDKRDCSLIYLRIEANRNNGIQTNIIEINKIE